MTSRGAEKTEAEEKIKAGAMPCFNVERFRGVQRFQARGSGAEVLPGRISVELANTYLVATRYLWRFRNVDMIKEVSIFLFLEGY